MDQFDCTLEEFTAKCQQTDSEFKFENAQLQQSLDMDENCNNRGDYFEQWIKLRVLVAFGHAPLDVCKEFYQAPMKVLRLKSICSECGISSKAGGNYKADMVFAHNNTSFKYFGGGAASLAAPARRSLIVANTHIQHLEEILTGLFQRMFKAYPHQALFRMSLIEDPADREAMRQLVMYYCAVGSAKCIQNYPASAMLAVENPVDTNTYFYGTPGGFVERFWDTMTWEFRSRKIISMKGLNIAQINRLIIDMEWNDPARQGGKPHIMLGIRVGGKRRRTLDGCEEFPKNNKQKIRNKKKEEPTPGPRNSIKVVKDTELHTLVKNKYKKMVGETGKSYGSLSSKWHTNVQAYEVVMRPQKVSVSCKYTKADDVVVEMARAAEHSKVLLYAQEIFKIKMKSELKRSAADSTKLGILKSKLIAAIDSF